MFDEVHAAWLGEEVEYVIDEAGQEKNEVEYADDEQRRVALHRRRRIERRRLPHVLEPLNVGAPAHAHRRHHDDAREHDDVRARVRHDDVDDRPRDQPELVAAALPDVRADHPLLQPRLQSHETPSPEAVGVHAYQHDDDQHDDDARMRGLAHRQEALWSRGDDGQLGGDARH